MKNSIDQISKNIVLNKYQFYIDKIDELNVHFNSLNLSKNENLKDYLSSLFNIFNEIDEDAYLNSVFLEYLTPYLISFLEKLSLYNFHDNKEKQFDYILNETVNEQLLTKLLKLKFNDKFIGEQSYYDQNINIDNYVYDEFISIDNVNFYDGCIEIGNNRCIFYSNIEEIHNGGELLILNEPFNNINYDRKYEKRKIKNLFYDPLKFCYVGKYTSKRNYIEHPDYYFSCIEPFKSNMFLLRNNKAANLFYRDESNKMIFIGIFIKMKSGKIIFIGEKHVKYKFSNETYKEKEKLFWFFNINKEYYKFSKGYENFFLDNMEYVFKRKKFYRNIFNKTSKEMTNISKISNTPVKLIGNEHLSF